MMRQKNFFVLFFSMCVGVLVLGSCHPSKKLDKDHLYFQTERDNIGTAEIKERVIQVNDLLNIQVISKTLNQQEAALFNQPSSGGIGDNTATSAGVNNNGYLVGIDGNIELPLIGSIKAEGLTKNQLQKILVELLSQYIKEPSVSIRYLQFTINVLGEVRSPGIKNFPIDRVTIIDAISAAGDLTDEGKRRDITVIREDNGKKLYILVDMTSGSLFQSPAYQLQPYDIVYVGANEKKLHALVKGPNPGTTFRTIGTALSVFISLLNLYIRVK